MTTEDAESTVMRKRGIRPLVRIGAISGLAMLALAGCSSNAGYIDAWWDNGDPMYAPFKADLFDEEGTPRCDTPTAFGNIETRARAFTSIGGVVNSFLFEVTNTEPDPATAADAKEKRQFERQQGSLDAMYQLTWPRFDEENGIASAEDMADLKAELQDHLPGLGVDAPITDYVKLDRQWIDGPQGHFSVRRASDPEGYIKDNKFATVFNGVANQYFEALSQEDGSSWLLIVNKESGLTTLMSADEEFELDEETASFSSYLVEVDPLGVNPELEITLVNDQCPPASGDNVARYWIYELEMLDGKEPEPVTLE